MAKLRAVKTHFIEENKSMGVKGIDAGSITDVLFDPNTGLIYVGRVASNNDIFYTFNPKTKQFCSLNYQKIAEKNEVKVHRALHLDEDGTIYGATACLLDLKTAADAPGGCLFKYHPKTDKLEKICIPCPHTYIQSIALDRKRKIIYGLTYPYSFIFKYELKTGKAETLASPNSFPHDLEIDDNGVLWTVWRPPTTQVKEFSPPKFISYNPDKNELIYHHFGPFDDFFRFYRKPTDIAVFDFYDIDSMFNGGDGHIYIGSVDGCLYRFNPGKMKVDWLGKPSPGLRIAGLTMDREGLIYGVSGQGIGEERVLSELWSYDREKASFSRLGPLIDKEKSIFCDYPHGLTINDQNDSLFIAETDTPQRPSAVWECFIER